MQIAIVLAQGAPLLIADEPTSQLDLGATAGVAKLLRGLTAKGYAVLLVVHDLALAAAIADRIVVMSEGRTVAAGPPKQVLTPALLERVWHVDARLEPDPSGTTALHVSWLGSEATPPDGAPVSPAAYATPSRAAGQADSPPPPPPPPDVIP